MASDKFTEFADLYNEIGRELGNITHSDGNGVLLYAEVEEGVTGASVFRDEETQVRYFVESDQLIDLLRDLWHAEDPDKRWSVMEYWIIDGQMHARFLFADELDPAESEFERRPRALKERYGDKTVIYPPIPEYFQQYTDPSGNE